MIDKDKLKEINDNMRKTLDEVKKKAPHLLGSLGKFGGRGQCGKALEKINNKKQ